MKQIKLLFLASMVILFTACGSSPDPDPLPIAIAKIEAYANNNTNPAPTLQDYKDAGVTGVTAENLDDMNSVVASLTPSDVDTTEEIQKIVDDLGINIKPVANPGPDKSVEVNQAVTITGSATDIDGTIVSYEWKKGTAVLAKTTSFDYTPTAVGTDTLTLTVMDDDGDTATDSMTVTVTAAVNKTPTANAGVDQNVTEGDTMTLNGSGSTDSDGIITAYEWKEGSNVLSTAASFTKSDFSLGTHTITLTIADNDGAIATDSMTVTVTVVPNQTPTANAGVDQNVTEGDTVTLDGSGSTDSDGMITAYQWKEGSTLLSTEVSFDKSGLSVGTHTITLKVADNEGAIATDSMTVVVAANTPPVANAGPVQNIKTTSTVVLDGSGSSDTDDGHLLMYSWSIESQPVSSTAVLSDTMAVNPTFVADLDGTYVVQLVVNDGMADSTSDTVAITATTGNAAPVANAGANQNIKTTSTVTLDGSLSSDADGDGLTSQWNFASKPADSNATLLNETDVYPTFVADLDGSYEIQLRVNDGTVESAPDTVIITATTANAAPVAHGIAYRDPVTTYYPGDHIYLVADATDADGDALTYHWSFLSRPAESTVELIFTSNDNTTNGDFYPDAPGTYVLQVKVNDGTVDSNLVQITITVSSRSWGTAELVETGSGDARFPQIAMDANGNAVTVWQQDNGTSMNIMSNRYVSGSGWGTAEAIESDSTDAQYPQIAMDPNGNAVSVWEQNNSIFANRYMAGSGWGMEEVIETNSSWARSVQIAMDSNGNAIAVWNQVIFNDYSERSGIWANRYVPGSGWGTVESLDGFSSYTYFYSPQIAMDTNGNAIVVWDENYDGEDQYINSRRYVANIGWFGSYGEVVSSNIYFSYSPQIAMDANGSGITVWQQDDGININIMSNRYVAGNGWGTEEMISCGSQIAMDASGNAIAVCGGDGAVYAQRYVIGTGWGIREVIGSAGSGTQIAMDANGNAIVVWVAVDGSNMNIMTNCYVAGIGWGTAEVIETGSGEASSPQIAMDDNGNAMAVWYQYDGTSVNIMYNRFE